MRQEYVVILPDQVKMFPVDLLSVDSMFVAWTLNHGWLILILKSAHFMHSHESTRSNRGLDEAYQTSRSQG
jgi:hypothetical protein